MIKVLEEWEKIMLKNSLHICDQDKLIGPSTLLPGSNDLCCDLLENICKQSRPIDSKRVNLEDELEFLHDISVFTVTHENNCFTNRTP